MGERGREGIKKNNKEMKCGDIPIF